MPIGHNFLGLTSLATYCAQVGHADYDNTKNGFTEEQLIVADLNGDETINVIDIVLLVDIILN